MNIKKICQTTRSERVPVRVLFIAVLLVFASAATPTAHGANRKDIGRILYAHGAYYPASGNVSFGATFYPPGVVTLVGPNSTVNPALNFHIALGSRPRYDGGDCLTQCVPSFAVTDPLNFAAVNAAVGGNPNIQPAPANVDPSSLPTWLQSAADLDPLIHQLRIAAQHSGTYYVSPSQVVTPGNASGEGITFCEGDCTVRDGGGILVVTGGLRSGGGFNFKGLILIVGQNGWRRNGGGGTNAKVAGSVIIAPYVLSNGSSAGAFLPPYYDVNGSGGSTVLDVSAFSSQTSQISDSLFGLAAR